MRVVITDAAWNDTINIARHIANDSLTHAETFLDNIHERCIALGDFPQAYPFLKGYEAKGIRRRVYGNYLIFYRVGADSVDVLHIFHGAREIDPDLFDPK
ncbi:type II toxin-antitoxin system RelE/ParE family toxin [Mesorhizobium sp. CAU 1732]|uniref:type II toxin-antitoxin system RelE/ParE family toxin n=1 Tax=Mesorhizobium sp. CAU 1732 TaxID=3140358 RepID=UPI00326124B4